MSTTIQKAVCFFAVILLCTAVGHSQATVIVQEQVSVSRVLAGHADIGIPKVPAEGITVDLCGPGWQTVLSSTKTDKNGYFSFEKHGSGKLFYVRLSAPGVNTYQLRVRIIKHGPLGLKIHLANAT